ncbi:hypothetical protein halTADL_0222 [Halohasta litchfieldiae]|jgi:hypothetical protein|uniref:Uncharacterized protein n=1 Tax=Halohasta litchfieldiae TaxID=1073996 RepID=A0A1H6W7T4_9EURY|nr:hypothetical protein [Halohasta litchfieldiae]ATW87043.1 hypothetical protein halTADL_0222 [Halohasta litchfieldiae]SEJ13038.1 hypothetical protein SAMN05444271_12343 [Halohasta litchfieldiae]
MTEQPESGELLVGSYLRLVEGCELVMYNQRSQKQGDQLEIDVIGVKNTEHGEQVVYTCEVVTHIDGLHYSGTPNTDRWAEYGNEDYQHTLERLWQKFKSDKEYVTELFDSDDYSFIFQFWSPVVRGNRDEKYLLTGLYDMTNEFDEQTGTELELVINEEYTECMKALREKAGQTEKDYGELGFRILQILEHLR